MHLKCAPKTTNDENTATRIRHPWRSHGTVAPCRCGIPSIRVPLRRFSALRVPGYPCSAVPLPKRFKLYWLRRSFLQLLKFLGLRRIHPCQYYKSIGGNTQLREPCILLSHLEPTVEPSTCKHFFVQVPQRTWILPHLERSKGKLQSAIRI